MQNDRPVLDYARPSRAVRDRVRDRGTMHFAVGVAAGLFSMLVLATVIEVIPVPSQVAFLALLLGIGVAIVAHVFNIGIWMRVRISGRRLIERAWWISCLTGCSGAYIMAGAGILSRLIGSTPAVWMGCLSLAAVPLAAPWIVYRDYTAADRG